MADIAELKSGLAQTIETLAEKRDSLTLAIDSLKEALAKLSDLSEDHKTPISASPGLDVLFEGDLTPRLAIAALRTGTQFHRIAMLFVERKNEPITVAEISQEIHASRSATTNILYRTQKEAFASARVPGHSRLKAWRLRPDLYKVILEKMRKS